MVTRDELVSDESLVLGPGEADGVVDVDFAGRLEGTVKESDIRNFLTLSLYFGEQNRFSRLSDGI